MTGRWLQRSRQGRGLGGEDLGMERRDCKASQPLGVGAGGVEPPPYPKGFIVLPRRWVVERSFAWNGQNRRLSKDYERVPETGEAFMYVSMVRLMVRRLARS